MTDDDAVDAMAALFWRFMSDTVARKPAPAPQNIQDGTVPNAQDGTVPTTIRASGGRPVRGHIGPRPGW